MKHIKLLLTGLLLVLLVGCTTTTTYRDDTYEYDLGELDLEYNESSDVYTVYLTETNEILYFNGRDVNFRLGDDNNIVVKETDRGTYELFIYFDYE